MINIATTIPPMASLSDELARTLPWSPLDFIRELNAPAERMLFAEQLTRPLPETDDLRFVHQLAGGDQVGVFAERLPWDSNFFGYGVARLNGIFPLELSRSPRVLDYRPALDQLLVEARQRGLRYMFALVEPRDLALMRALCATGFALIETRCFYHTDLRGYNHPRRYKCRAATSNDIESLAQTAERMINNYDRFHADPFIDPNAADRLMRAWVEASIMGSFADTTIVPDTPEPRAFCTVRYHRERWERLGARLSQPVFSAVDSECRGWYLKIISEIHYHLQEIGAEHAYLSTQITNRAVIRVWEKLGYNFGKAEHVFRIVL